MRETGIRICTQTTRARPAILAVPGSGDVSARRYAAEMARPALQYHASTGDTQATEPDTGIFVLTHCLLLAARL